MPRARTQHYVSQTAAARPEEGSGCLSGYMIPPLAVLVISFLLAAFAFRQQPAAALPESTVTPIPTAQSITETAAGIPSPTATLFGLPAPADPVTPTPFYALTPTNTPAPWGIFKLFVPDTQMETSTSGLASIFTPEVQYWGTNIVRWASEAGLDPNLAAVVMQIESCGFARATSRSGAMGLFQVMPFHFQPFENPYDPDVNARRGLAYLARSLEAASGNPRLALAGYNGGIGVIDRSEWTWPSETNRYVYYGAPIYEDARNGLVTSQILDEWYSKYGASLCRQARESQ